MPATDWYIGMKDGRLDFYSLLVAQALSSELKSQNPGCFEGLNAEAKCDTVFKISFTSTTLEKETDVYEAMLKAIEAALKACNFDTDCWLDLGPW